MPFSFPKIYPILDSSAIPSSNRVGFLHRLGSGLAAAGVTLLEYRNKTGSDTEILSDAAVLRAALPGPNIKLILDDRADLVDEAGFDGVHIDAGDISAAEARKLLGSSGIVGSFGGSTEFLPGALDGPADYLAIGPVFTSTTKQTSITPIGIEGVRRLRELAGPDRILTAAGGVTLSSAPAILAAGASAVAVSAAIFRTSDPAAEFRLWLNELR
ncbi:MAG TPA: thiamine phosphate synthase [Terracidiphilus sp.]|nr:thiamine phosphate synthase [Terracidiphilus sp.]